MSVNFLAMLNNYYIFFDHSRTVTVFSNEYSYKYGFHSFPSSDLSSASPLSKDRPHGSMPPPLITPTRLQTIRNQTLKLHLPGSGRSYIPLATGSVSILLLHLHVHVSRIDIESKCV